MYVMAGGWEVQATYCAVRASPVCVLASEYLLLCGTCTSSVCSRLTVPITVRYVQVQCVFSPHSTYYCAVRASPVCVLASQYLLLCGTCKSSVCSRLTVPITVRYVQVQCVFSPQSTY
jgi:hypothetical protein